MKNYRFKLDDRRPRKKFTCPSCGKASIFVRYIDSNTMEYMPLEYGKCERSNSCNYWLNPYKDGYAKKVYESDRTHEKFFSKPSHSSHASHSRQKIAIDPSAKRNKPAFIPFEVLTPTLTNFRSNAFTSYLYSTYGEEITNSEIARYYLGTSDRWPGATTFPFIDINGKIRAIQVKQFNETLHTAKYKNKEGELVPCIGYHEYTVKYKIEKRGDCLPAWLDDYFKNEKRVSCFFGEHLLNQPEHRGKTIAIVEAPKTAIIADIYFTHFLKQTNVIWLAVGALGYLTQERCEVLKDRKVILYPDLKAFDKWRDKASELSGIAKFSVSDLLERKATGEERHQGLDLADYLLKLPFQKSVISDRDESISSISGSITSNEILQVPFFLHTGSEFNHVSLVQFDTANASFKILFNKEGELIKQGEQTETVKLFAAFFEKEFYPLLFDDMPCWGQLKTN